MSEEQAGRTGGWLAGAAAAFVGAAWSWSYDLGLGGRAAVVALHFAAGWAVGLLCTRGPARVRLEAGGRVLTGALLFGAAPALATALFPGDAEWALLVAAVAAGAGLAVSVLLDRRGGAFAWSALAVAAAIAIAFAGVDPPPAPQSRALEAVTPQGAAAARLAVIGLDGADWQVLDPLLAAGELPNLARLVARGRSAVLRSTDPSHSPVVWNSIFSGRPPEQHGIEGWYSAHTENRRVGVLWEIASAASLPAVVVNVPGTWPPTPVEGALVSGFPIPGALRHAGRDPRLAQNVGSIVSLAPRESPLHTTIARRERGAERPRARVPLGAWPAEPRTRWRHFALEAALARGWLPLPQVEIALGMPVEGLEEIPTYRVDGRKFPLERGAWSPWLEARAPGGHLFYRLRTLADGALFVTPAFQDPRHPLHPYTSTPAVRDLVAGLGMYVVEPAGWKSADDPGTRDALFEHLLEVEQQHAAAALALRAHHADWRLFVHVITLPDRTSHPFWRFHRPADYPAVPGRTLAAHRDKVARAYRESDRLLGLLLDGLGDDTAVIVASDHGFTSAGGTHGDHRPEGMLVAAGPGIAAGAERLALSLYDVMPAALVLLGLPVAEDLARDAPVTLLAPELPRRAIASYERPDGAGPAAATVTIDASTEEQLRGLGYVD